MTFGLQLEKGPQQCQNPFFTALQKYKQFLKLQKEMKNLTSLL